MRLAQAAETILDRDAPLFGGPVADNDQNPVSLTTFGEDFFHKLMSSDGLNHLSTYQPTEGSEQLRLLMAEKLGERLENILVTEGASRALDLTFSALVTAGDSVLVPRPWFPAFWALPTRYGATVHTYEATDADEVLRTIKRHVAAGTKLVVVNYPHNPSGVMMPATIMDELGDIAAASDAIFLWDKAYSWLSDDDHRYPGIRVYSLGKLLGLPGLRIGALVSSDRRFLDAATALKRHVSLHSCPLAEVTAATCLERFDLNRAHQRWREKLKARLEVLKATPSVHLVHGYDHQLVGPFCLAKLGEGMQGKVSGCPGSTFGLADDVTRLCLGASSYEWSRLAEGH